MPVFPHPQVSGKLKQVWAQEQVKEASSPDWGGTGALFSYEHAHAHTFPNLHTHPHETLQTCTHLHTWEIPGPKKHTHAHTRAHIHMHTCPKAGALLFLFP